MSQSLAPTPPYILELDDIRIAFVREAQVRRAFDRDVDRIVGRMRQRRYVEPRIVAAVGVGKRHPGFQSLSEISEVINETRHAK